MLSQQQMFSSQFAGGVPIAPRRQHGHMRSMTDSSGYNHNQNHQQGMNDFVANIQHWNFDHPMQSIYSFPGDFGMDLARTQSADDFGSSNLDAATANAQFMRGGYGTPTQQQALPPRPSTPTKTTSTTPVGGTPKTPFHRTPARQNRMSVVTPSSQRQRQVASPITSYSGTDSEAVDQSDTNTEDRASKPQIDTDACLVPTGITETMINKEMTGPDPGDGQYTCLYEGCGKRFGRKENIRSHVQTHLGDRRYVCPSCDKPFVRAHDLKRHFSIHDGERAFKCKCGNSFARHDALTRHRQRGMCVGAFDGCVKKSQKRGRPRKARPTDVERSEKSKKTRTKNMSISSVDSFMTQSSFTSHESPRPGTRDSDMDFGSYQPFGSSDAAPPSSDFDPMATIRPRDYQRMQQNSTAPMPSSSPAPQPVDHHHQHHGFPSQGMTPQSHVSLEEIEQSPLTLAHTSSSAPLSPSDVLLPTPELGDDFPCSPVDLTGGLVSPSPFEVETAFANAMQGAEVDNNDFSALDMIDFWN